MLDSEYQQHLKDYFLASIDELPFWRCLEAHARELAILSNLNFDPARELLDPLYSPVVRAPHRSPTCMLRSLVLMTLLKVPGITAWVKQTRTQPLLAVFAGFDPQDTPGVGTYYDFMKRLINGPYQKPCEHRVKPSVFLSQPHLRNLPKENTKAKTDTHQSQSEILTAELLASADEPRPNDLSKILEDLLFVLGIKPSIQCGLLNNLDKLIVSGDGSILQSAASATGRPTCSCRSEGIRRCEHDRLYSSPTAKWCYDAHRDCYLFGDRYYHLVVSHNGHDLPLLTLMPGGDESDFTLSLKAFDAFLKAARENGLDMHIAAFCGDGHHDSYAHYRYFQQKCVTPVIPLSEKTKNPFPHLLDDRGIRLDTDGTPLCPASVRMRHHQYNEKRHLHVYTCPAKRHTHRDGPSLYVMHLNECPNGKDCSPESPLGPLVYIKSETDPRLYPPIPRSSKRFKEIMNLRSSTERCNYLNDTCKLDHTSRNAAYGLIRLVLANIAAHAVVRYLEEAKKTPKKELLRQTLEKIGITYREEYLDTG